MADSKVNRNLVRSEREFEDNPEVLANKKPRIAKKQQGELIQTDGTGPKRNLKFAGPGTPKLAGRSKDSVVPKTPVMWTRVPKGNQLPST